jgi:hypothetical protein
MLRGRRSVRFEPRPRRRLFRRSQLTRTVPSIATYRSFAYRFPLTIPLHNCSSVMIHLETWARTHSSGQRLPNCACVLICFQMYEHARTVRGSYFGNSFSAKSNTRSGLQARMSDCRGSGNGPLLPPGTEFNCLRSISCVLYAMMGSNMPWGAMRLSASQSSPNDLLINTHLA